MHALDRSRVTPYGRRKPHLFLSHNSSDKEFVRRLAKHLNRFKIDAWLDEWEIEVGDSLHNSIGAALIKSKYIGVVISPPFLKSRWCMDELHQALAREKRQQTKVLIPMLYKRAVPPPFIEDRLYLDFGKNYHVALTRLCALLHEVKSKKVSEALEKFTPRNVNDVGEILLQLGWDNCRYVDRSDFDRISILAEHYGIKAINDELWFSQEQLERIFKRKIPAALLIKRLFEDED